MPEEKPDPKSIVLSTELLFQREQNAPSGSDQSSVTGVMIAHDYSVFNDRAAVEVEFGGVGSAAASFRVATSAHAATTTAVPPALGVTTGAVVVAVADRDNHRVQVLTPAGNVVRILGEDGTPGGSDLGDLHEAHPCG